MYGFRGTRLRGARVLDGRSPSRRRSVLRARRTALGLTEAGFDVILAVDNDDEALETHRSYHPGLSVNWDLADADVVERVGALVRRCGISLIAGGPPCQPFSRAGRSMVRELVKRGRRHQHDRRRDLWDSFLGVIELSPDAVVMENAPAGARPLRNTEQLAAFGGLTCGSGRCCSPSFSLSEFHCKGGTHVPWHTTPGFVRLDAGHPTTGKPRRRHPSSSTAARERTLVSI